MQKIHWKVAALLAVTAAFALPLAAMAAEAYPSKPVRLVVPWATGGFNDILARLLAEQMSKSLGQQVIVDNRAGAAGTLGSGFVAQAAPDGYTLLLATGDTHAIAPAVYPKLRYDPQRDFAPISLLVSQPVALWVPAESSSRDLAGFIATAKANPGKVTYASNGNGSVTHLGMEAFAQKAGINLLHVPYKGSGPALIDMLGGRLDGIFLSVQAAGSQATSGKIRPLAFTSAERSSALPAVPTFSEAGVPGFQLALWQGLVAPKGTPPDIVNRLAIESAKALAAPEIRERMASMGVEVIGSNPERLQRFLADEVLRWKGLANSLNVKLD